MLLNLEIITKIKGYDLKLISPVFTMCEIYNYKAFMLRIAVKAA